MDGRGHRPLRRSSPAPRLLAGWGQDARLLELQGEKRYGSTRSLSPLIHSPAFLVKDYDYKQIEYRINPEEARSGAVSLERRAAHGGFHQPCVILITGKLMHNVS